MSTKHNEAALVKFSGWYGKLRNYPQNNGPAKGTIAGALVVLERLREGYDLNIESHTTKGGSQIAGASGAAVKQFLKRNGETRKYVSEGGRTNRGLRGDIGTLLETMEAMQLESLEVNSRNAILDNLQWFLIDRVSDYHNRRQLKLIYDPQRSLWYTINNLLESARDQGKEGPVAQYLVGAKLQLRFPDFEVGNESYSTADVQLDRPGDFVIKDTVFHVTVSPQPGVYEKSERKLENGARVYILVPSRVLEGTRQLADLSSPGKIAVASIEAFVSQNIDELSYLSSSRLVSGLLALLETYNKRVNSTEIDKSMMIKVPPNLIT